MSSVSENDRESETPIYSSKDLLNRHLDISDLVKRLMFKRRQQLDLQYVILSFFDSFTI